MPCFVARSPLSSVVLGIRLGLLTMNTFPFVHAGRNSRPVTIGQGLTELSLNLIVVCSDCLHPYSTGERERTAS